MLVALVVVFVLVRRKLARGDDRDARLVREGRVNRAHLGDALRGGQSVSRERWPVEDHADVSHAVRVVGEAPLHLEREIVDRIRR